MSMALVLAVTQCPKCKATFGQPCDQADMPPGSRLWTYVHTVRQNVLLRRVGIAEIPVKCGYTNSRVLTTFSLDSVDRS